MDIIIQISTFFVTAEKPRLGLFVSYDLQLLELTMQGFQIYSFSYLFMGMAVFGSSFFAALNNGGISAVISFFRTLVFELGAVLFVVIKPVTELEMTLFKKNILSTVQSVNQKH